MTTPAKFVITGDAAQAEREAIKMEKRILSLETGLKRLGGTGQSTGKADPFAGMVSGSATAIARIVSVTAAVRVLKAVYDDLAEAQKKAFDAQKGTAAALEGMAINIDIPLKEAEEAAKRIASSSGVPVNRIMASIGTAFSAKGQLGAKDAIGAVETTAKLIPNLPDAQDLLTGATLDIRKFDPKLSSEQAQGFLMRAMVQARVTELSKMAEHGSPAITGMAMLDRNNPQALTESAGIYGAITQGMRDPHGRKSRTAGTALVIQAREFLGEAAAEMTNTQVLETIAQDRAAHKAFFRGGDYKGKKRRGMQMTVTGPDGQELSVAADRASFERQAMPVLESMLTPGTEEYKNWKSAGKAMGDIGTTGQDWQAKFNELQASQIKQNVDLSNRLESTAEANRLADFKGANWNTVGSKIEEGMQSAGVSWTDRFAIARKLEMSRLAGSDPLESGRSAVQGLLDRTNQEALSGRGIAAQYPGTVTERNANEIAKKNEEMAESLKKIVTLLEGAQKQQAAKPLVVNGQRE